MKKHVSEITVGLFGTFEVDNYGDLLFPVILRKAIERHIPNLDVKLFSPLGGIYKHDGSNILAVFDLEKHYGQLDAIVIGGGDIIRFDTPPLYQPYRFDLPPYAYLWAMPVLYASLTGAPVVWNAPGVSYPFSIAQDAIVKSVLSGTDYVSVRDDFSAEIISLLDGRVRIIPDSGFLISAAFPKDTLCQIFEPLKATLGITQPYLVFHLSRATSKIESFTLIADSLKAITRKCAFKILLLPLGPVHGEIDTLQQIEQYAPADFLLIRPNLRPLEIASIIAHSEFFVGTSLHGNITAFSYGVPGIAVNNFALAKLRYFGELTGRPVLESWQAFYESVENLVAGPSNDSKETLKRNEISRRIEGHFKTMAEILLKAREKRGQTGGFVRTPKVIANSLLNSVRMSEGLMRTLLNIETLGQEDAKQKAQQVAQLASTQQKLLGDLGELRATVEQFQEVIQKRNDDLARVTAERERLLQDVGQLAQTIAGLDQILAEKEAAIFERNKTIERLETAQSGLFWELLSSYRRAKDRYLPMETRRRDLYDWSLETVKGFKGGGRSFAKIVFLPVRHPIRTLRNLNSANLRKLLYDLRHGNHSLVQKKIEKKLFGETEVLHLLPKVSSPSRKFCLIMSGCPGDAYRYRCEHQAEQLRFLGLTVDSTFFDRVDYPSALESYQVFWLHRVPHTDAVENFIRAAEQAGKPVIFDTDDLVFDEEKIPYIRALKWMPQREVDLYYDGVRRYHRTLSRCRFATVTTEPLRRAIQRVFPHMRCLIISNVLSDIQVAQAQAALAESRPAEDEGIVRIAYFSGTHTHNVDFQQCSSALVRVLDAFPQVRLVLVGHLDVGEEFARLEDRVERRPLMPWQELPRLLRRVDINLAPLEPENPFTECKSSLKYFEAALLSVPTVASDLEPYRKSIVHGENGYLCRTEDDWYEWMSRLVQDAALRKEMGLTARTDTVKNCTTRTNAFHLREALKEIVSAGVFRWKESLRVNFILRAPIAQVGGGYKVLFLLAHYLARRGHDVHVYIEAIEHLEGKSEPEIRAFCTKYFGESPAQIHVGHDSIAPCDVAIATNWPTAFVVDALPNAFCKLYLIQDFEPEFYEAQSSLYKEVAKTYELPLRKVTIGRYLADLFAEKDGLSVPYFPFAIDHTVFHARGRSRFTRVRVVFFARPSLKRRGFTVGVQALAKVYEKCPQIEILLYGMEEKAKLHFPYTNLGLLDQSQLAGAMRESDIHLSFSLSNISQVPFQAMACGCAVVEAKVPSVEAMVEDGRNCLLAEPDPEAIADVLLRLVRDEELRRRIAEAGLESVRELTWENSCRQFENILFESLLLDGSRQRQEDSRLSEFSRETVRPSPSQQP